MLVNQDGTTAGDELLEALDQAEQEPTAEDEVDETEVAEGEADESDEDEIDDTDEEEADEGEDDGTKRFTVKINGEETQVTLSELQAGYMKDADYRRKTAELADTRKRTEAAEAEYTGGLKTLDEQLKLVATFIASQINMDEAEMDKLAAEKPAEYVALQRQLAKQGNALQAAHNHLQRVQQAQADILDKKQAEFRDAENAKLIEMAPEFKKAETVERLHSYLKQAYGLSQKEIEEVADHRFALIADKARRFDAIKAKAALKDKQVKTTPAKFQKGGAATGRGEASKAKVDGALLQGATQDHIRLLVLVGLATAARPEAIKDLTWDRIDFKTGIITLNPPGRPQNKKHRPEVKVGPTVLAELQKYHDRKQGDHLIMFRNKRVSRVNTGWAKALKAAELDRRVNQYSMRHTVARYLREHQVDTMEIANMLGHKRTGFEITMRYMPHDPSYLKRSVDVLDDLISFCLRA